MKVKLSILIPILLGIVCTLFSGCESNLDLGTQTKTSDKPHDFKTPSKGIDRYLEDSQISPDPTKSLESPISIINLNFYRTTSGDIQVVGLARNNTDRTVTDIEVYIEIYDGADKQVLSTITPLLLNSLFPSKESPFVLRINEPFTGTEYAKAMAIYRGTKEREQSDIRVQGLSIAIDRNKVYISGELQNLNPVPIKINNLAAAIFNEGGNILSAAEQNEIIEYLDPGETGPFQVTIDTQEDFKAEIVNHQIYIDASPTQPDNYYELFFKNDLNYYKDKLDNIHLVGEITNLSQNIIQLRLLATLYDENGSVVDVSSNSNLPFDAIYPGETLPFDFSYWRSFKNPQKTDKDITDYSIQWELYSTKLSTAHYVTLKVLDETHQFIENFGTFTGVIKNESGYPLSSATVLVTLHNKYFGNIIAMNYVKYLDYISDGDTISYEIHLSLENDIDPELVDIQIISKGESIK